MSEPITEDMLRTQNAGLHAQLDALGTSVVRLRKSHDELLAAAKMVISKCPVPRGARRQEFDDLEDAIAKAEESAS